MSRLLQFETFYTEPKNILTFFGSIQYVFHTLSQFGGVILMCLTQAVTSRVQAHIRGQFLASLAGRQHLEIR